MYNPLTRIIMSLYSDSQGRRGRDRMVVGFITTYAISAYHHWCCEFESRSGRGVQHYVIKFVSGSPVSATNKTDHHNITEIVLKVTLNTIKQTHIHQEIRNGVTTNTKKRSLITISMIHMYLNSSHSRKSP